RINPTENGNQPQGESSNSVSLSSNSALVSVVSASTLIPSDPSTITGLGSSLNPSFRIESSYAPAGTSTTATPDASVNASYGPSRISTSSSPTPVSFATTSMV